MFRNKNSTQLDLKSKPAKRFIEWCKGYGLEETLNQFLATSIHPELLAFWFKESLRAYSRHRDPIGPKSRVTQDAHIATIAKKMEEREQRMKLLTQQRRSKRTPIRQKA